MSNPEQDKNLGKKVESSGEEDASKGVEKSLVDVNELSSNANRLIKLELFDEAIPVMEDLLEFFRLVGDSNPKNRIGRDRNLLTMAKCYIYGTTRKNFNVANKLCDRVISDMEDLARSDDELVIDAYRVIVHAYAWKCKAKSLDGFHEEALVYSQTAVEYLRVVVSVLKETISASADAMLAFLLTEQARIYAALNNLDESENTLRETLRLLDVYGGYHLPTSLEKGSDRKSVNDSYVWTHYMKHLVFKEFARIEELKENDEGELHFLQMAIDQLDQSLSIDGNVPITYYRRGDIYKQMGDQEAAIADYKKAVALAPNQPWFRLELARALHRSNMLLASMPHYFAALQSNPGNTGIWKRLIQIIKTRDAINAQNVEEEQSLVSLEESLENMAENELLRNIPQNPKQDHLYLLLANQLVRMYRKHDTISTDPSVKISTSVHELAGFINLVGPALVQFPIPLAPEVGLGKATKVVLDRVDTWNRKKSQTVTKAFAGVDMSEKGDGFVDDLTEMLIAQYGEVFDKLQLSSSGLMAFVATIIERLVTELGNDPELVKKIASGEVDRLQACLACIRRGKANYIAQSVDLTRYDTKDILDGTIS